VGHELYVCTMEDNHTIAVKALSRIQHGIRLCRNTPFYMAMNEVD